MRTMPDREDTTEGPEQRALRAELSGAVPAADRPPTVWQKAS